MKIGMNEKQKKKINAIIKFLKREPKKEDLRGEVVGRMIFDNKDLYKKYQMIDKHIKLVAKCLDEEYITYNYFFSIFERMSVCRYEGKLHLYVLFPNIAKLALFSFFKYREVVTQFFGKFRFYSDSDGEVDIENNLLHSPCSTVFRDRSVFNFRPKESNARPMFDFVGD